MNSPHHFLLFGFGIIFFLAVASSVESHSFHRITSSFDTRTRQERFRDNGIIDNEALAGDRYIGNRFDRTFTPPAEAPTGFDNLTNGFLPQGPDFNTINEDNVVALRSFNDNRFVFEEVETIA